MSHLLETISVGLRNKNSTNNHNILSIVLEQQTTNIETGQTVHKLSTVNFCDLNYGTEKAFTNQFVSEPKDVPMNFYSQPMLPPYPYFSPPNANILNGNYFFSPPPPTSPITDTFFNANFRNNFDVNPNAQLVTQQNQRLLKNAELLFSKLNLNDMDEDQRKEIQEWMYLKTECDTYVSTPSTAELPPSYFSNMNINVNPNLNMLMNVPIPPISTAPPQQSSLLPIIEMDETNETTTENRDEEEEEEEETNDNDSECGSYIDINDQSNNLFGKISDKISNFHDKADDLVRNKCNEYFENNPKVILSSGQSDCKTTNENLLDEAVGGGGNDLMKISTNTSTSDQYLTRRRRSIRDNILNSEELNLIKKAAAATSFETDSIKDNAENEQLSKLDEYRKSLKKSLA